MTNEGKASTIGFYEVVLGNPAAGFDRLLALSEVRPQQLRELAERYLSRQSRTVIRVAPQASPAPASGEAE
jgi:predicted Zn-dependent peptidase